MEGLTLLTKRAFLAVALAGAALAAPASRAAVQACPADLSVWKNALGAEWIDCHRVADLTATGNPYIDTGSLNGSGFPPPGSGTLNSHYSNPTAPPVAGIQIDGYFADACNAYQSEPLLVARDGTPFISGCTPAPTLQQTCFSECHHDAQFVIRIPDSWNGRLLTAGTPGIRDAFASDFVFSDYVLENGWAYVSQDKGNMGANFFRGGTDETDSTGTPWEPGAAIAEWTFRMRQATRAARSLLNLLAPQYGIARVTRSYAAGVSNGGYQTRRAIETDFRYDRLYYSVDSYGDTVLRPMLPCVRAAIDAIAAWVENGVAPPPNHTIARPQGATAADLANRLAVAVVRDLPVALGPRNPRLADERTSISSSPRREEPWPFGSRFSSRSASMASSPAPTAASIGSIPSTARTMATAASSPESTRW